MTRLKALGSLIAHLVSLGLVVVLLCCIWAITRVTGQRWPEEEE